MVVVEVFRDKKEIKEITISGHAKYDKIGRDIVCASASSIAITSVNLAIKVDDTAITYRDDDGYLKIDILNNKLNYIFENMIDMLYELSEDYPSNIKIKEK